MIFRPVPGRGRPLLYRKFWYKKRTPETSPKFLKIRAKKGPGGIPGSFISKDHSKRSSSYARSTLPLRKQEVQTLILLGVPLTIALTDLMFDFHIRFDLLCEWLTLIPK